MVLLQLALDVTSLERAVEIARAAARFFDILEAGTPLIKSEGLYAVEALRRSHPDKRILADMKTADTGRLEAHLALERGADIVTVLGCAPAETIRAAIEEAHGAGGEVAVDLLGLEDPVEAARRLARLGPDYVVVHRGIDEQRAGRAVDPALVAAVKEASGARVAVAGGLRPESMRGLSGAGVDVVVVGGFVTRSPDPGLAARRIREAVERWLA